MDEILRCGCVCLSLFLCLDASLSPLSFVLFFLLSLSLTCSFFRCLLSLILHECIYIYIFFVFVFVLSSVEFFFSSLYRFFFFVFFSFLIYLFSCICVHMYAYVLWACTYACLSVLALFFLGILKEPRQEWFILSKSLAESVRSGRDRRPRRSSSSPGGQRPSPALHQGRHN